MALVKIGENKWRIDYYDDRNKRHRVIVKGNKKKAEAILGKRLSEVVEGKHLDVKRVIKVPFRSFVNEYAKIWNETNKSWYTRKFLVTQLEKHFKDISIDEITTWHIEKFRAKRKKDGVKPSTINRELSALRHIINKAIEWKKLKIENPVSSIKFFKEHGRLHFLYPDELNSLIQCCRVEPKQPYLPHIVFTAACTGLRKSDITNLQLPDVDFRARTIILVENKTGEKRVIKMSESLTECLKSIKRPDRCLCLFHDGNGKKVNDFRKSFQSALKRSGIENFQFRDLRHTFASNLVMNDVDLKTVSELIGHKSIEMTMRYAHLSPEHKERAINKLDSIFGSASGNEKETFWAHFGHKSALETNANLKKSYQIN